MTRITRSMYDKDLQSYYRLGRILTWIASRNWGLRLVHRAMFGPTVGRQLKGVKNDEIQIPSVSTPGHSIRARVYRRLNSKGSVPAMLYIHGGGYQVGTPEQAHDFFADLLKRRDIAIIAPAYRLSLAGYPFPAGLNDCFDTMMHMKTQADQMAIKDDNFILAGHSGGGGMVAALTLKVVDEKAANIAFQMPIYPMLDHRMQTQSAQNMVGTMIWDRDSNALAWDNYIGHLNGDVPDYASPALRADLGNLPPTVSFVGDMEPFKDETIAYIDALKEAGVETRFKLFKGGMHGFEILAPKAPIAQDANAFQLGAFEEFFDKYT